MAPSSLQLAIKLALLKKIAIILSILVAVVILLLPYSGSFSQNSTARSVGSPQYTNRASQPSSATKSNNTQQKVMGHTYPKYWVKTTATQATHAVGNSYQLGIL